MTVHEQIVATVRSRIRAGAWAAGERLPTVRELQAEFAVSLLTIHRCLRTLAGLGFIITRGRHGTVVVDHPPHLCRFGLVLPALPESGFYTNLRWQALATAARTFTDPLQTVEVFHAIDQHRELAEHRRLRQALDDQRLAGLIVPQLLPTNTWFDPTAGSLPTILPHPTKAAHHGNIGLAQVTFLERALDLVRQRGLTSVAVLLNSGAWQWGAVEQTLAACAARGLTCHRRWLQGVPDHVPGWSTHVIEALFTAHPRMTLPAALIIADDHLVPATIAALAALGQTPLVIALANFPLPLNQPNHRAGTILLGWDHHDYLRVAISRIAAHLTTGHALGDQHLPLKSHGDRS